MRRASLLVALSVAAPIFAAVACDSGRSTTPVAAAPGAASLSRGGENDRVQPVSLRDDCDPVSFDAALHDPNACVRKGSGLPFDRFVAELTRNHSVGAWRIAPDQVDAEPGTILVTTNQGGETHTFTRVAAFGGGIVPFLNGLAGTPTPAPECNPGTLNFLTPGASTQTTVANDGTELYQCCIHPWMRMEVHQHHG